MKVIFLDLDGVLMNALSLAKGNASEFRLDPKCVAVLNRVTSCTQAKIVLTSAKRRSPQTPAMLKEWGVKSEIIGITPSIPDATRGEEIKAWLSAHAALLESFIILDDEADVGEFSRFLVRIDWRKGLTISDGDHAVAILQDCRQEPQDVSKSRENQMLNN